MCKENEKCKSTENEHIGKVEYNQKTKFSNHRHKKGKKTQVTWVEQIFNKIIEENFLKLRKDILTQMKHREHQINKINKRV